MNEYIRLADRINDEFALGLKPHDENRGFVKLFAKMMSKREASLASALGAELMSTDQISEVTGIKEESVRRMLKKTARKGLIYEEKEGKQYSYKLLPFVPGIFEALVHASADPDIAGFLRQYTDEVSEISEKTNDHTIPINTKVDIRTVSVPMAEINAYLDSSNHYAVMDCICRTIQAAQGNACEHSIKDMCILIGSSAEYYIRMGLARSADRDEVTGILQKAEAEGLIHEMYPMSKSDSVFICNCCTCGCLFLKLSRRIHSVIAYEGRVHIDTKKCSRCGVCISRCPEQVFSWSKDGTDITIESARCFECGMCRLSCPEKAISVG